MVMTARLPKLIAFDLDYTLWDLWIDTHVTPPFRRNENAPHEVLDKYNEVIKFYKHVPQILHRLRKTHGQVKIAVCSRTDAPKLARQALRLLLVPQETQDDELKPAIDFFDHLEIYPGSKITHFKKLHEATQIPYSDMLFFDDESRNREVQTLGVTFWLVKDGLNNAEFEKGLEAWRKGQ